MTQPTPRELKQGIAAKLATMPAGLDSATGKTDIDRAADAAIIAGLTAPEPDGDTEQPHSMIRNRAQGHSGPAVPAPAPASARAAILAKLALHI